MGHTCVPRNPRGQQRDKIYREALRLERADMSEGVDLKKLRQIARAHIEKAAAGDMQAIKELANRMDGRPAQILEHSGPDSEPIGRIVREIVHVNVSPEEISAAEDEPVLIDWRPRRYVRPGSCARAASGHAAAAPPSSNINSRRLIIRSPRQRARAE